MRHALVDEPTTLPDPSGTADAGHTREVNCLDCGAKLVGPHCSECGQKAHLHRTIAGWWHDFQHSVLHLDGSFWRTLPMLALRPGELTRRYIEGERTKFISPLALFLFTVFLMFAVLTVLGASTDSSELARSGPQSVAELQTDLERNRQRLALLEAGREVEGGGTSEAAAIDVSELRQNIAVEEQVLGTFKAAEDLTATFRTGWPPLDEGLTQAIKKPALSLYKLQANAYKFSWALIPISVAFVWLLFLHRRRYRQQLSGYDHLVFVTYSIAFMSLVLVAFVLVGPTGLNFEPISLAFLIIPPVHLYRQLRGAYRLSRASALWRTIAVLVFALFALAIFTLLLLFIGILG